MRQYLTLVLLSVVLASSSPAQNKPKQMSILMMETIACDGVWAGEQEPNPFLINVTEFEEKGVIRFRSNTGILENYPDAITLRIEYALQPGFLSTGVRKPSAVCDSIDPSLFKFKALWSNISRALPADVVVLQRDNLGPEPFCELRCADVWNYKLRIKSKNIPLTDNLLILVDSPKGKLLAKLVGALGPLDHLVNPVTH